MIDTAPTILNYLGLATAGVGLSVFLYLVLTHLHNTCPYLTTKFRGTYSEQWEDILNYYLDNYTHVEIDTFNCILHVNNTSVKVWVGNFPYAYGNCEGGTYSFASKLRPSRRTIARLRAFELDLRETIVDQQAEALDA
jgi:hypothetical protein